MKKVSYVTFQNPQPIILNAFFLQEWCSLKQMIANILLLDTPLHWIVWLQPVDGEILRFVQVSM